MYSNPSKNILLSSTEQKDLESYCKLNGLDVDQVVKDSYLQGFRIEKYGLLSEISGRKTEPEIKEVIIEKPIIEYVEVIKEIPREVIIEKIIEHRNKTGLHVLFTLDAGANVHVLYPESEKQAILPWIQTELVGYCQNELYFCNQVGTGPQPQ